MIWGKIELGRTVYLDRAYLEKASSVRGSLYEIRVTCERIPDPKETIEIIKKELPVRVPRLEITGIEVVGNLVKIQVRGSPFPWALVLINLPLILAIIGIAVVAITVFLILLHVPSWVYALLFMGMLLTGLGIFLLPKRE